MQKGEGQMKTVKTIINGLSHLEDVAIYMFCILLFLMGIYAMLDSYLVYQHANDDSLLKFKPGYDGEEPEKEIKGNMVAWLTINDTSIDYPVMQGKDNHEYLNKDPYGEYSLAGSIFLDSRNTSDFTDDYSLVYGHHMEGNSMFGELHSFLDRDYFNKHKKGTLMVGNLVYDIQFFAVMETSATEKCIFAPTEEKVGTVLSYINEHAKICDQDMEEENAKVLALSTCSAPDSINRVVVFGRLENPRKNQVQTSEG